MTLPEVTASRDAGRRLRVAAAAAVAAATLLGGAACTTPAPVASKVSVPTLSPVISQADIAGQLHTVLAKNFPKAGVADCVHTALLDAQTKGKLGLVDLDNYVRNVVTDPMRSVLLDLQNAGTCTRG